LEIPLRNNIFVRSARFFKFGDNRSVPVLLHVLVAATIVSMVVMAVYSYDRYSLFSQEDHEVEWATVVFYLAAAVLGLKYALRHRRLFDGLVAMFCFFNGGEEFSWGQRLLGFSPPNYFLESNLQQEVSLHNFFGPNAHDLFFGTLVLGYFLLLPLLSWFKTTRTFTEWIGASAPPFSFAPWAILLVIVYVTYPFHLVGEWIEVIVAALFLAAAALFGNRILSSRKLLISLGLVLLTTGILTWVSNAQESRGTPERVSCAQAEVRGLLYDLIYGAAAGERLWRVKTPIHRRIFVAGNRGYVRNQEFKEFRSTQCTGFAGENSEARHRYVIDPWGLSYWVLIVPLPDGSMELTIYSFGPDRRRDSDEGTGSGGIETDDDIGITGILSNKNAPAVRDDDYPVFSVEP